VKQTGAAAVFAAAAFVAAAGAKAAAIAADDIGFIDSACTWRFMRAGSWPSGIQASR